MNKVVLLIFITICIDTGEAMAQEYRYNNYLDLAVSGSSGRISGALSWSHLHGIGKKERRLNVGYGLRFTSFVAANKFYTTAPAKYTSPVQSVATIFSETIAANIDTVTTATAVTNSLNAALFIHYRIARRWFAGVNIDVVGFSFGPKKTFNVISGSFDPGQAPVQMGSPTSFNLLLTSDNDIGSLNSEFYMQYWITARIGARLGYTFLFSEYRTDVRLSFNDGEIVNDRYRYKAGMALLAVTFKPFMN